jgi:succinate dehydrogenase/fumarate reductase flavoprotein subunit
MLNQDRTESMNETQTNTFPTYRTTNVSKGSGSGSSDALDMFDVIVVGAGTAGLPCAISAAVGGARVLLIDKADKIGGTLHLSGGHMSAAGARRQHEFGIEGDSAEQHFDDIVRISEHTIKRDDLVRIAVDHAAETIDWLQDQGFEFDPRTPRIVYGHEPYSQPRTYYGVAEGRSTLATLAAVLEPHLATGAITLALDSRVGDLIAELVEPPQSLEGRSNPSVAKVVGVRIESPYGDREILASHVVLATGGFAANDELFAELDGRGAPLVSAAVETSTGDGLIMARALGGAVAGVGDYLPTFGGMPHPDNPSRVQWVDRPLLVAEERAPWEIYVDRYGNRFIAEDDPSVDRKERALTKVEDLTFWMIFDEQCVTNSPNIVVGWTADDMRSRANQRAGVHAADTLPQLAALAGIDADGLAASINAYNESCTTGQDSAFGRTTFPAPIAQSPFYALKNHGITLITFAGLDVDDHFRVRRSDGSIIEGLYGIGELLGSSATMGNSFCSGMLVGPCLTFGRLLGTRLAVETQTPQATTRL